MSMLSFKISATSLSLSAGISTVMQDPEMEILSSPSKFSHFFLRHSIVFKLRNFFSDQGVSKVCRDQHLTIQGNSDRLNSLKIL